MRGARSTGDCIVAVALLIGVIAVGWGALAMYSQKAMIVAGLG